MALCVYLACLQSLLSHFALRARGQTIVKENQISWVCALLRACAPRLVFVRVCVRVRVHVRVVLCLCEIRPCVRRFFPEIFVFASFGNCRFLNFNICFPNISELVKIAIFVFASFGNCRFLKIRVGTSFLSFFRTRPDSRKLVPTQNSTLKFG